MDQFPFLYCFVFLQVLYFLSPARDKSLFESESFGGFSCIFAGCVFLEFKSKYTAPLTISVSVNGFKRIYAKATFKCPKKMLKKYKSWLKNPGGAPKTAKFK